MKVDNFRVGDEIAFSEMDPGISYGKGHYKRLTVSSLFSQSCIQSCPHLKSNRAMMALVLGNATCAG